LQTRLGNVTAAAFPLIIPAQLSAILASNRAPSGAEPFFEAERRHADACPPRESKIDGLR
jgi:hypothetical protein